MRSPHKLAAAAVLLLTGCATPASQQTPTSTLPQPAAIRTPPQLALARGALTVEEALASLGPAFVERRDGRGALLTWRREGCALTLVFLEDAAGRLRLSEAVAADPRTGAPRAPESCAQ